MRRYESPLTKAAGRSSEARRDSRSRARRTYVGVQKGTGACEVLIVSFAQENQGGGAWGDVYIKHWGMQLDPSSLHFVGTFEAPFPATCEVVRTGMTS